MRVPLVWPWLQVCLLNMRNEHENEYCTQLLLATHSRAQPALFSTLDFRDSRSNLKILRFKRTIYYKDSYHAQEQEKEQMFCQSTMLHLLLSYFLSLHNKLMHMKWCIHAPRR